MNEPIEVPATEVPAPVVEPSPVPRARRTVSWVNITLGVAVLIAIGGVAFAAGRLTAPAAGFTGRTGLVGGDGFSRDGNLPSFVPGQGGFGPGGGFNGAFGAGGGLAIEGTVESVDTHSMTIRTASGQTIEIALNGDTTYHSQASASAGDIASGGSVIVRVQLGRGAGTANEATASDVTVVP